MENIFILLVAFQIKHFLSDYPLQNEYMLGKFKPIGWVKPLACHCLVHGVMTLFISLALGVGFLMAFGLMILDFSLHFIMDRVKAHPSLLGKYKPDNSKFWWSLGFDQMFHHLTHYFLIYLIIS